MAIRDVLFLERDSTVVGDIVDVGGHGCEILILGFVSVGLMTVLLLFGFENKFVGNSNLELSLPQINS